MAPQTTKERAGYIADRSYFQRPDWLTSLKHKLALAALALGLPLVVWLAVTLTTGWGASALSPGPVAAVHATWDNRCDACHVPFHGIRTQDRCTTCHGGPAHFADQSDDANRCATCHNEHRGRGASLVRLPDSDCVGCHRDLGASRPGAVLAYQPTITSFVRDHPLESRSVRQFDPNKDRTLKFSHAVHMSKGMVATGNPRPFRFIDIKDTLERKRFQALLGETDAAAAVQLDCRACHRLDTGDSGLAGANPLPITFENQCKACHPLSGFDDREPALTVPHRVQPAQLREFLKRTFLERLFDDRLPLQQLPIRRDLRLDRPDAPTLQEAKQVVEERIAAAEPRLLSSSGGCRKCHLFADEKVPFAQCTVRRVRGRDAWYAHARFTHVAHRAVSCKECHAGAYADLATGTNELIELEAPLVPDVRKCLDCHGPIERTKGGARSDCVECHRYHHGQGPEARDPKDRLNLEEFLRGRPTPHAAGSR